MSGCPVVILAIEGFGEMPNLEIRAAAEMSATQLMALSGVLATVANRRAMMDAHAAAAGVIRTGRVPDQLPARDVRALARLGRGAELQGDKA